VQNSAPPTRHKPPTLALKLGARAPLRDGVSRLAALRFPDCAIAEVLHMATATAVFGGMLTAFVSYDEHQFQQARAAGLPTESSRSVGCHP